MRVKHKHELFFTDDEIVARGPKFPQGGPGPPAGAGAALNSGHAHFRGKNFVHLLGIPHTKPHTKFEVSSSSSFRDIAL